ncbi:MAG: M12 family metallo-peptidase [Phycisphaerae bacterium]|nr:M12 family metallo-peptidase [Phycisphaerae bacterium]
MISFSLAIAFAVTTAVEASVSSIEHIDIPNAAQRAAGMAPTSFSFAAPSGTMVVDIGPWSARSDAFVVKVASDDDASIQRPAQPARTFRGGIRGAPDSIVQGGMTKDGLCAVVLLGDDGWSIQPDGLGGHDAKPLSSLSMPPGFCAVLDPPGGANQSAPGGSAGGVAGFDCGRMTELAFDADFEFFVSNGSSVDTTVADIEAVLAGMQAIYAAEIDLQFVVTAIVVRTTSDDPYTTTNHSLLLGQLSSEWQSNQADINRDLVHLMTGKNLDGSTIGVAFNPGACNPSSMFALSQSKYSNNFAQRVLVTAHEIGHNLDADHCNGQSTCGIMCNAVGGCNGSITTFGTFSVGQIVGFVNAVACLGPISPSSIVASNGTVCGGVEVVFTPARGAFSHTVYRYVAGVPVPVALNATSPYFDSTAVPGVSTNYAVTATYRGGCESDPADGIDAGFAPFAPNLTSGVVASDGTSCTGVSVVWSAASGAASYEIWRSQSGLPDDAVFVSIDSASPFLDGSAVPETVYRFFVRTVSGCGELGPLGTGDLGSRSTPPSATAVDATDGTACPDIAVSWAAVPDATGYALWRSATSNAESARILATNASSPYVDNDVPAGAQRWYWVQSLSNCGAGDLGVGDQGASGASADLDGNCHVDGADLAMMLGAWNTSGPGDLNGSGAVDGADLAILLGAWTG